MKKRVYGIETEYGLALITKYGKWSCDHDRLAPYLQCFMENFRDFSQFHANGARIYLESGFHPEYATAECASLLDLIAQDKAGERILRKSFDEAIKKTALLIPSNKRIALFKNNVQYNEYDDETREAVTCGCHENFLLEKKITVGQLEEVLLPFLVARQIFCGAGWVANKAYQTRRIRFMISQRARFIGSAVGTATNPRTLSDPYGSSRAILCTARFYDEPHADKEKYSRLHLILGDSNLSELCIYLKMGTISILLEMLEEGYKFGRRIKGLRIKNPVLALKLVSQDLTCKKPVIELENGKFISAVDLLWVYVDMMSKYERINGLSPELADVRKKLEDVLWRFERREIDRATLMEVKSLGLDMEIDWLIKKAALENSLSHFGSCWNDFSEKVIRRESRDIDLYDQLRDKDLKYHDISDEGLYYFRQPDLSLEDLRLAQINTPRMVEEEKIIEMMENPPQDTRARLRGEFVKWCKGKNLTEGFNVTWERISWSFYVESEHFKGEIFLSEPLVSESTELAELFAKFSDEAFLEKIRSPYSLPNNWGRWFPRFSG